MPHASDNQHECMITKVSFINMESDGREPDAGSWRALHECPEAPRIRPKGRRAARHYGTTPHALRRMMAQVVKRRQQCHRLHHLPARLQGQPHQAERKLKEAHSG